ncbi:Tetratricopeptide repeat [Macleaya cordata]|uniref:Tetratricopeptide repeat n=1 Tax=Macleaya cordata TaxID=56857 RepID=A0A200PW35_MACCD|nr:Tetratricopeptide repeat [Macleaya cordata]
MGEYSMQMIVRDVVSLCNANGEYKNRASDFPKKAENPNEPLVDQIISTLEFKGSLLVPNSLELAENHKKIAKILVEASMFKKALLHCLKALDIYKSLSESAGEDRSSSLVGIDITRGLLRVIYVGLEDYEEAMEQSFVSRLNLGHSLISCELVLVEIDYIRIQISRGAYDLAMLLLKILDSNTDDSGRVLSYIEKAHLFIRMKKYEDSKICLETCFDILEKLDSSVASIELVTTCYTNIARVCQKMDKLKIGKDMSLLKKTMIKLEKLGEQSKDLRWDLAFLIGKLKVRIGMESEAIEYLLKAENNFKDNFGSKHYYKLGKIYKYLGKAFSEVGDYWLAIHMLRLAKENFDVSVGPDHWTSIQVCENLSTAYRAIERYGDAIELLERVIEALAKQQGPNAQDQLGEAHQRLEVLRKEEAQSNEVNHWILPH